VVGVAARDPLGGISGRRWPLGAGCACMVVGSSATKGLERGRCGCATAPSLAPSPSPSSPMDIRPASTDAMVPAPRDAATRTTWPRSTAGKWLAPESVANRGDPPTVRPRPSSINNAVGGGRTMGTSSSGSSSDAAGSTAPPSSSATTVAKPGERTPRDRARRTGGAAAEVSAGKCPSPAVLATMATSPMPTRADVPAAPPRRRPSDATTSLRAGVGGGSTTWSSSHPVGRSHAASPGGRPGAAPPGR
jgi:hypothetical protein